ncbi:hypothetical protein [Campylobacter sp. MG1]|uniref:hypothetical protein n=1 Tax=Campylobacter sp. MG1 TaxID=2976332 RepID=UPI00226D1346|nr:hypothetical protein [Campylobacter sp. MG1]
MSKDTKTMICPFCDEELRFGVKVCRGCQAEITYDDGSSAGGIISLFAFALAYVIFFISFLGDSFFDKLTNFGFYFYLLIDVALCIGAIKTMDGAKPKAKFERRQFR